MAGYTRQSTFADGDTITSALFNNEYNQLLNAFGNTSGHKHDGTANEGPVIGLIGDAGIVTPLNKVLIDSTNDHIEFWIEVSSSSVQQLYIADGAIVPVTDNDIDLGTSSLQFKDLYINGTANIDSLVLATGSTVTAVLDEDDLSSNSATSLVTQQSVKAYIDAQVTAQDLDFLGDSGGALSIDLDSESLTIAGGTGLATVGSGNTITVNIDSTVATLTGSQTLTNKTIDVDNNTVSNIEVDNFKASAIVLESEGIGSNDNDTSLPTSAAVKDYVDTQITAEDLDITTDSGTIAIDLDSETLTVSGGTGLDSSATGNAVTLAIDSTVTTLTGTQTLTNKTLTSATLTSPVINTGVSGTAFLDDDTFATATASTLASSESIKAYVDTTVAATNEVVEDTTPQLGGDLASNGNDILFADNDKAIFGTGSDLQIYHDASDGASFIKESGSGHLRIQGSELLLEATNGDNFFRGIENGSVRIYHDNSTVLQTTSTGIDVTGTVTTDGLTVDGGGTNIGIVTKSTDQFAFIGFEDNTSSTSSVYIGADGNDFIARANSITRFRAASNGDISFYEDTGSTAGLFWDASAERLGLGTTSPTQALDVTGNVSASGTVYSQYFGSVSDTNTLIQFAGSDDIRFRAGGTERLRVKTTGIDVTGTVTAGGLTVDANSVGLLATFIGSNDARPLTIDNYDADFSGSGYIFNAESSGGEIALQTASKDRIKVGSGGDISFYEDTGTTQALFWDASAESLGIGTTSPAYSLDVSTSSVLTSRIQSSAGETILELDNTNTNGRRFMIISGGSSGSLAGGKFGIFDATASATRLAIDSSGNVGIGTDSPSSPLHVAGTVRIDGGGNSYIYSDASGVNFETSGARFTRFLTNSSEAMRIDSSGNVGIGITNIATPLHVSSGIARTNTSKNYTQFISSDDGDDFLFGMAVAHKGGATGSDRYISIDSSSYQKSTDTFTTSGSLVLQQLGGNVGIGVTPSSPLHVNVGTNQNLEVDSDGSELRLSAVNDARSTNPAIRFQAESYKFYGAGGVGPRATIDSSGNVGIGTTSPDKALTISASDSQIRLYDADGTNQFASFQSDDGIAKITSRNNTSHGQIAFQRYNGTVVNESMRIDSSGNLLVGKTSATATNLGCQIENDGQIKTTTNGQSSLTLNRKTSDGSIAIFQKDGSTVGSIGVIHGNNLFVGAPSHSGLQFGTSIIYPTGGTTGDANDATVDIGASGQRFKDLYLSGTINSTKYDIYNEGGGSLYQTDGYIRFSNGNTETVRIDSSGNLLVATTDTTLLNNTSGGGFSVGSNGFTQIAKQGVDDADPVLILNQTGLDGEILRFYKDGGIVGSIGSQSGTHINIDSAGNRSGLRFEDNALLPRKNSAMADGTVALGNSIYRFKDLYLSGGVQLGGTGAANKLEDYEEGTFSVTVDNLDGFAGTPSSATFTYTKIGNKVFCEGVFFMTGSSGNVAVDDSIQFTSASLPFTPSKLGTCLGAASVQTGAATGDNCAMGYVALADSGVYGIQIHNVNGTVTRNNAKISFKITYETTA